VQNFFQNRTRRWLHYAEMSVPISSRLQDPVWRGLEYLHRSLASRRRRRKGNPVPGIITGPPVTRGHKYRDLVLQVGEGESLKAPRTIDSKIWS
jgi:hypothetical protein